MTQDTDALLAERETTHGRYEDHAGVTQALKRVMKNSPNWEGLPDIIKETLEMTMHKVARVLTGNAFVVDHFADIQGYNRLVEQRIDDKVGLKPEVKEIAALYGDRSTVISVTVPKLTSETFAAQFTRTEPLRAEKNIIERRCANSEHKQRVLVARAGYKAGRREGTLIQHVARGCGIRWGEAAAVCRELGFVKARR